MALPRYEERPWMSIRGMPKPIGKVHVDPQPEENGIPNYETAGIFVDDHCVVDI